MSYVQSDKVSHYVLRAWKSCDVTTWSQTSIFKSQIIVENGFWGQTNQLSTLPISNFFKKLFSASKIVKKNVKDLIAGLQGSVRKLQKY